MKLRILPLLLAVASVAALTNVGLAQAPSSMEATAPNVGTGWAATVPQSVVTTGTHTYTNTGTLRRYVQYGGYHSVSTSNISATVQITQVTFTGEGNAVKTSSNKMSIDPGTTMVVKVTVTSTISVAQPGNVTVVGTAAASDGTGGSGVAEGSGTATAPVAPAPAEEPGDEEEAN